MARRSPAHVRAYNADAIDRLRSHVQGFSEEQLDRAAMRARVAVIRKVQPIAKRDIRDRYGVRASALNGKFKIVEGTSRKGSPYIGVWASSRRISLIEFQGRHTRGKGPVAKRSKGATAQVLAGQTKTYDGAFISTIRGVKAIRVRSLKGGDSMKRHGRGPLQMLRGPSPHEMLLGADMRNGDAVAAKILDVYQPEIQRQLTLLRRSKR